MPKTRVTVSDILLLAGFVLLAVLLLLTRHTAADNASLSFTVLTEEGKKQYPLQENMQFSVTSNGITLTVVCKNGQVSVTDSGCSDRICVRTGWIGKPGESIVCLPAKIAITVTTGEKEASDEDFIIG